MSYPNIFFMIDSFEEVSAHRWPCSPSSPLGDGMGCQTEDLQNLPGDTGSRSRGWSGDSQWGSPLHSN